MFTSQIYLYQQNLIVLLNTVSSSLTSVRWSPVYAKKLKLHKGTDNVLTFSFVNQDQKPVSIGTATFTFRLIDSQGENVLLTKTGITLDATRGKLKVIISESELDSITAQNASYSIERSVTSSDLNDAAFVDDNAGGRGVVEILESVMPKHVSSQIVTIPAYGSDTVYNSSEWQSDGVNLQTVQYIPSVFTGTVKIQGSVDDGGLWYDISSAVSLTAESQTKYINIIGYHPYLRFNISKTSGNITSITVR